LLKISGKSPLVVSDGVDGLKSAERWANEYASTKDWYTVGFPEKEWQQAVEQVLNK
jgi:hypothetical protein